MTARIYKPSKTAMQSGKARTRRWVLDYEPESAREVEPLMGWTSSGDMNSQVKLSFDTKKMPSPMPPATASPIGSWNPKSARFVPRPMRIILSTAGLASGRTDRQLWPLTVPREAGSENGPVAQLDRAASLLNRKVAGSNPAGIAIFIQSVPVTSFTVRRRFFW